MKNNENELSEFLIIEHDFHAGNIECKLQVVLINLWSYAKIWKIIFIVLSLLSKVGLYKCMISIGLWDGPSKMQEQCLQGCPSIFCMVFPLFFFLFFFTFLVWRYPKFQYLPKIYKAYWCVCYEECPIITITERNFKSIQFWLKSDLV